ncbi:sigma-54 dependent transcriptional regulator [Pendulispora brunnea]|uniref:Sigma-54 dependent transcriptional regulator n=1 Tax=Pendulispora brunnea TaxID=2905690 RepID=A0ABZ2K0G4_9BACT
MSTASARILVAEDERAIQLALSGLLRRLGYEVEQAHDGAEALRKLQEGVFDLVLTDLALGEGPSGMDVLRASKEARPETPVVMITAYGSEKVAVQAMKSGAEDYVPKPFDNDEIRLVVTRALDRTRLAREHRLLLERVTRDYGFASLIGAGPAMRTVFGQIQKVAETDLTVLVRGESGSGKELVAQAIHQCSPRSERPFVPVNCAAISRELVESELFGHEKGAFTGASARRIGRFEAASGGTIFLDEIGDMPLETQAKVLRVLEERSFERVGGNRPIEANVRVVAATHRDLEAEVARGRYREDLYYRLKVVEIVVPPLRERLEDVPALVSRFLERLATRLGRDKRTMSSRAMARLAAHSWPGNVRELRHVVEQAAVLASEDVIDEADLRLGAASMAGAKEVAITSFSEAKRRMIEDFERRFIATALERHGGNISQTADAIGMVRQSLQQKMKELGLRADGKS